MLKKAASQMMQVAFQSKTTKKVAWKFELSNQFHLLRWNKINSKFGIGIGSCSNRVFEGGLTV